MAFCFSVFFFILQLRPTLSLLIFYFHPTFTSTVSILFYIFLSAHIMARIQTTSLAAGKDAEVQLTKSFLERVIPFREQMSEPSGVCWYSVCLLTPTESRHLLYLSFICRTQANYSWVWATSLTGSIHRHSVVMEYLWISCLFIIYWDFAYFNLIFQSHKFWACACLVWRLATLFCLYFLRHQLQIRFAMLSLISPYIKFGDHNNSFVLFSGLIRIFKKDV